jgi:hypothetical protein
MGHWWRRLGPENNFGIAAGQRFCSVGPASALWEVIAVNRYDGDLGPHVRLSRVGVAHEGKTVSLQVLRDRRFYQPAS